MFRLRDSVQEKMHACLVVDVCKRIVTLFFSTAYFVPDPNEYSEFSLFSFPASLMPVSHSHTLSLSLSLFSPLVLSIHPEHSSNDHVLIFHCL